MEKKIIFLELSTDIVEKIDDQNKIGTRSIFISDLLEKQLTQENRMDVTTEISTSMHTAEMNGVTNEVSLVNSQGVSLGKFNIDTGEGFESLAEKICEISNDPIVRMKARHWR
jgi:hypothetical protein